MVIGGLSELSSESIKIAPGRSAIYRQAAMNNLATIIDPYLQHRNAVSLAQPRLTEAQTKILAYPQELTNRERTFNVTAKLREAEPRQYEISYNLANLPKLSTEYPRSKLELPRIDPQQIKKAKEIKTRFLTLLEQKKPSGTIENIRPIYLEALKEVKPQEVNSQNPIDMEALVYSMCVTESEKILPSFPRGYIKLDDDFVEKMRTMARYVFSERNKIFKPEDLSKISSWKNFFNTNKISFNQYLTVKDLLKLSYPGWLEGDRPLIRPHTLTLTGNYAHQDGEDCTKPSKAAIAAAKCIFLDQDGVVDENGFYVPDQIASIDWHEVYRDRKTGIPNLIQDPDSKQFGRIYDAFDAAAPGLIGTKPGQIAPWHMPRYLSWDDKTKADKQCQEILRYALRKAGALTINGVPIASLVRELSLGDLIAEQSNVAMAHSSYTNTYELFCATFPEAVGWRFDQINPGDISYDGIWKGKSALDIIKKRFAKGMYQLFEALKYQSEPGFIEHNVCFDPDQKKVLEIGRNEMQALKIYMSRNGISWKDLAVKFGIQSAFEARFDGSTKKFFEGVFGKANPKTTQLGNSGIYLEDVEKKITNQIEAIDSLENELDSVIKATDVIYRPSDDKNLIEYLIDVNNSRPDRDSYTRKLYIAFATTKSKKLVCDESLGDSVLAKMLSAKKKNSEEYYLSPRNFNGIIDLLITVLVDRTNLTTHVKGLVKERYQDLISTKERRNVLRERLLDCIKKDKDFHQKNTFVSLINRAFELAFGDVIKYEAAFKNSNKRHTTLYTRTVTGLNNLA